MAKLTAEQWEYFTSMENTLDSPGWALLEKGWKDEQAALPERVFFNAKEGDTLMIEARIRYELLGELIGLRQLVANQREAIETEEEEPDVYV
jgi:hypothetical protein